MSQSTSTPQAPGEDPTIGALVVQASEQSSELIRSEIRLAQAEISESIKHVGIGAGAFGGAGVLALYGVGLLLAAAVAALSLVLPVWAAALIVAAIVFAAAGIAAVVGKKQVAEGTPLAPEQAVAGVKLDVAAVKGGSTHE